MAKRAALSAFAGSTIEYFDFVIFATASALVFSHVFFAGLGDSAALIASLGTFGVAYVARPFGAIWLGRLGDRVGRRHVLTITLYLMGGATFLIGCLPDFSVLGPFAPIALVALRLVQGISAGAEQAGSNTLSSEHAPKEKRGLYTSWTMQGVVAGSLLASAVFLPITAAGEEFLLGGGWRIPFLAAGPLMLVAIWIRNRVDEPEVFTATVEVVKEVSPTAKPLGSFGSLLRNHWGNLLRVVFCSFYAITGTILNVFVLAYGTGTAGIAASSLIAVATISGIVGLIVQPFMAILSDRIGRKPVFIGSVLSIAAGLFLIFPAINTQNITLIGLALVLINVVAVGGNVVQGAFYTEMFPTEVRYTAVAVGTQFGLVFVGFTPAIAAAIQGPGETGWIPVALFAAGALIVAAISAATAKETRGLDFTAENPVAAVDVQRITAG